MAEKYVPKKDSPYEDISLTRHYFIPIAVIPIIMQVIYNKSLKKLEKRK